MRKKNIENNLIAWILYDLEKLVQEDETTLEGGGVKYPSGQTPIGPACTRLHSILHEIHLEEELKNVKELKDMDRAPDLPGALRVWDICNGPEEDMDSFDNSYDEENDDDEGNYGYGWGYEPGDDGEDFDL